MWYVAVLLFYIVLGWFFDAVGIATDAFPSEVVATYFFLLQSTPWGNRKMQGGISYFGNREENPEFMLAVFLCFFRFVLS